MEYSEDDFLMISGIQHFLFCRRQWALIHIEQEWKENVLTYSGQQLHQKTDQPQIREKRGDKITVRAMPVHSREFGLSGICDVVEFNSDPDGVHISGTDEKYTPLPVEYKHGHKKYDLSDTMQLLGEAICLEEMTGCEISHGEIYYHEVRRRENILFTSEMRETFTKIVAEMHEYWRKRYTPKVRTGKWCRSCSLRDICLPEALNKKTVASYLERRLSE